MRAITIKVPQWQDLKDAATAAPAVARKVHRDHMLSKAVRLAEKSDALVERLAHKEEV